MANSIIIGPSTEAIIGTKFTPSGDWKYITLTNVNIIATSLINEETKEITLKPIGFENAKEILTEQAIIIPNSKTLNQVNNTIAFDIMVQIKWNNGIKDILTTETYNVTSQINIEQGLFTNPTILSDFAPNVSVTNSSIEQDGIKVALLFGPITVNISGQGNVKIALAQ